MIDAPAPPVSAPAPALVERLLLESLPTLRAFIRARMSAELRTQEGSADIAQSVCRELVRALPRFREAGGASLRAWLLRTAEHKMLEHRRWQQRARRDVRRQVAIVGAGFEFDDRSRRESVGSASSVAEDTEQVVRVEQALGRLPHHYREVLGLVRIGGLSQAEAGARTGRSTLAVRKILGRALRQLGRDLGAATP